MNQPLNYILSLNIDYPEAKDMKQGHTVLCYQCCHHLAFALLKERPVLTNLQGTATRLTERPHSLHAMINHL